MGHASKDVWSYTPRRIAALLFLAGRRLKVQRAEALYVSTMGARGDMKVVKKELREAGN